MATAANKADMEKAEKNTTMSKETVIAKNMGEAAASPPQRNNIENHVAAELPNHPINEFVVVIIAFSDRNIRRNFIRKVYSLLLTQLLITAVITAIFVFLKPLQTFMKTYYWITYIVIVLTAMMFIFILCFEYIRRTVPLNLFCLFLCNLMVGVLLGVLSARYSIMSILLATSITFAVFFGLTIFSLQTRWDITMMGGLIFAISMGIVLTGLFLFLFWGIFPWLHVFIAGLMSILICVYIVYDTQLLVGGRHRYALSPEEYVYASFNLYIDIVYLFCMILTCCGVQK